jgi:hypothetical protein
MVRILIGSPKEVISKNPETTHLRSKTSSKFLNPMPHFLSKIQFS